MALAITSAVALARTSAADIADTSVLKNIKEEIKNG